MSNFRRRLMMSYILQQGGGEILPPGYEQLQWIETTYEPYGSYDINTKIKTANDTNIESECMFVDGVVDKGVFIYSEKWLKYALVKEAGDQAWLAFRSDFVSVHGFDINRKLTIKIVDGTYIVDDKELRTFPHSVFTSSYIHLFADAYDKKWKTAPMRLYSFKMCKADKLVRDFIPCRNDSKMLGLYDLVERIFYPNEGKATFIAGPKVL